MARKHRSIVTEDPFIVATGRETIKPEGQARKFIRSHVMQGKNKGKGKGIKKPFILRDHGTRNATFISSVVPTVAVAERPSFTLPPPERIFSTTCIEPSNPAIAGIIHEFMAVMKRAMYPVERYIGVGTNEPGWFYETATSRDAAYAHILAYSAHAFFDTAQRDSKTGLGSQRALVHMSRGIRLLRKRISTLDFASTNATIFLVLALGMFAEAHDELEAAKMHLGGLYQLVALRGGIRALSDRRFLQIKCCRLDLALALRTGSRPLFFAGEDECMFSQSRLLEPSQVTASTMPLPLIADFNMCEADTRLISIWLDLRAFATAINFARRTCTKISADLFQDALISVHYRLHRLAPDLVLSHEGEGHDALRLAILSFSTTFFLEVHSHKFEYLAAEFHSSLQARHVKQSKHTYGYPTTKPRLQELDLWMIFVAALSILSGPQYRPWLKEELRKKLNNLQLTAWDTVEAVLSRFLWVGSIHNAPAKAFFESLASI